MKTKKLIPTNDVMCIIYLGNFHDNMLVLLKWSLSMYKYLIVRKCLLHLEQYGNPKTNSNKCCMSNVYMVNLHDNMLVYGCFQDHILTK